MISLFIAASALAPQQHCGVETRVWCLRAGEEVVGATTQRGYRIWSVTSEDIDERITIKESLNCDFVSADEGLTIATQRPPAPAPTISESRSKVGKRLRTEILYEMPIDQCKIEVSWNSPLDDLTSTQGQVRRTVLSAIWLGVSSKTPLMFLMEKACSEAGGIQSFETFTCSTDQPLR